MITHILTQRLTPILLALLLTPGTAGAAGDTPPEKPIGLSGTGDAVGTVGLAPHNLPGSAGDYELRAREVGIAPGGAIHSHPHAGRPGIVRVTKGTVIEYRGENQRTLRVGEVWYENADTVHWFRNPSNSEMAELWVVDLVPIKK